jgi:hypothetical protein
MPFCLGEQVETTEEIGSPDTGSIYIPIGFKGTVVDIRREHPPIGVCFDEHIRGHCITRGCSSVCDVGYGAYIYPEFLKSR